LDWLPQQALQQLNSQTHIHTELACLMMRPFTCACLIGALVLPDQAHRPRRPGSARIRPGTHISA
jgi:hypothetical protein